MAVLSKVMAPSDANLAGNVHGGTTMALMEDAAWIVAARHSRMTAVSASIDKVTFLNPLYIGHLATARARLNFVSKHSMEVEVAVYGEDHVTGETRLCNRAFLTYVAAQPEEKSVSKALTKVKIAEIPSMVLTSDEEKQRHEEGMARYQERLDERTGMRMRVQKNVERLTELIKTHENIVTQLTHVPLPGEATSSGVVFGGVIFKLVDTAAGVCAFRHCRTNVVTVMMERMDLLSPVRLGDLVTLTAVPTFASSKSLEIAVVVTTENARSGNKTLTGFSRLVFVSLNEKGRPIDIKPLEVKTDEQREWFEQGKKRYEARRNARSANK